MQRLMFPDCFVQKLSKKNLWGFGSTPPPPLVNEGLKKVVLYPLKLLLFKEVIGDLKLKKLKYFDNNFRCLYQISVGC